MSSPGDLRGVPGVPGGAGEEGEGMGRRVSSLVRRSELERGCPESECARISCERDRREDSCWRADEKTGGSVAGADIC